MNGGQAATAETGAAAETDKAETDKVATDWWLDLQQSYWDGIADRYDELYQGRWSMQENGWVAEQLAFIAKLPGPTVLDLGCGTGLGLSMVRHLNPEAEYWGVDVSPRMVEALSESDGTAKVHLGPMDDLQFVEDKRFDVVISLFSSVSYAYDAKAVMSEISRVLAPDGRAYLSFLSPWGLSRIRNGIRYGLYRGLYRTRGDRQSGKAAPVRRHTVGGIRKLCDAVGLTVEQVTGMNVFSGLAEVPAFWSAGQSIARRLPNLAHTIEITLRKQA